MRREKWLAMVRDRTSKEAAGRRVRGRARETLSSRSKLRTWREGEQGWEREGLVF